MSEEEPRLEAAHLPIAERAGIWDLGLDQVAPSRPHLLKIDILRHIPVLRWDLAEAYIWFGRPWATESFSRSSDVGSDFLSKVNVELIVVEKHVRIGSQRMRIEGKLEMLDRGKDTIDIRVATKNHDGSRRPRRNRRRASGEFSLSHQGPVASPLSARVGIEESKDGDQGANRQDEPDG